MTEAAKKKNTKGEYADLLDLLSSKVKHKDMVHSVNVWPSGWFSFIAATGINAKRWGNVDNWSTKANWINELHLGISAQQIILMLHFKLIAYSTMVQRHKLFFYQKNTQ